ncbi:hypothetical protein [Granulosicoccus antarcticus]|uniref:Uncharacterized protein n=1 Tax=Granulosicoccus antarcticus IMCC3135 TaxID=1192854 RepID=A0A2Z2P534_9GAMM|nr:hypothetical protein [Granulosicoccus antarcticus]ASJ76590.1 hypothetical protein IMCC3135_32725 [Granulosicoccus antarcticus IMCC3135]
MTFHAVCLSQLVACGGSSGSVSESTLDADNASNGFVVIEQRSEKFVFDAWFTRTPLSLNRPARLWENGTQFCDSPEILSLSEESRIADSELRAGTQWRKSLFAGESIDISSRDGTLISLQAQRYGDAVLYATDERWIDAPLPDDAHLSVSGSETFPAFDSVALAPMAALVRELPVTGILQALAAPIAWQASTHADDRIELTLSGRAGFTDGSGLQRVKCSLDDNGGFTLPDVVQAALSGESSAQVSLVRKRETRLRSGEATLSVVQISYP